MPRRYRRRRYYPITRSLKAVKYSSENFTNTFNIDLAVPKQYEITYVYGSEVGGMRKVKNFTANFDTNSAIPFLFALVFVPQGTTIGQLNLPIEDSSHNPLAGSLYEPNQNVILAGSFGGPGTSHSRYFTRLARNLNSGDRIILIYRCTFHPDESTIANVLSQISFAIAY